MTNRKMSMIVTIKIRSISGIFEKMIVLFVCTLRITIIIIFLIVFRIIHQRNLVTFIFWLFFTTSKLLMDPSQHDTKQFLTSSTSKNPKKWQVMQLSNTCLWNVLESVNWAVPWNPKFLTTDSIQQFGNSLLLNTSPISSDNFAALACHSNITRSTDSEAVQLPIKCLQHRDLPLLRRRGRWTSEWTLGRNKNGRFHLIKTSSPQNLRTVSPKLARTCGRWELWCGWSWWHPKLGFARSP